jgi:hypothetical protein
VKTLKSERPFLIFGIPFFVTLGMTGKEQLKSYTIIWSLSELLFGSAKMMLYLALLCCGRLTRVWQIHESVSYWLPQRFYDESKQKGLQTKNSLHY